MIGLILLIMAISFYFVLSDVIHRDESHNLEAAARKATDEWLKISPQDADELRERQQADHKMEWEYLQSDQFAAITDVAWRIAAQYPGADNPLLTPSFRQQLDAHPDQSHFHISRSSGNSKIVYAVLRVSAGDEARHILLIGEDVTKQEALLQEMKLILIAITLLLLAVATFTGYIFAGRAMIPINQAFTRQQKFTAYASHELRTPLSVLQLAVDILEEEEGKLSPVHQKVLQDMKDEIQRMNRLTEQLLTLARNDSPLQYTIREPFDLQHSLSFAAARMQLVAAEKRLVLQFNIENPDEAFICTGDSEQIDQVLYILLDNAIKYSFTGDTITLGIYHNGNGTASLFIQDTGCGIPEADIPHLFERFFRVDQARTREHGGTGLGLAIAYEIVNRHGGRIAVNSTLHQGSTFTVILPETKRSPRQLL
ncbi:hypothetical protein KC345_g10324 [Hortaea werneckii]|nr:hypothetical protein KC345_g10324 [Hortaea werneckii]